MAAGAPRTVVLIPAAGQGSRAARSSPNKLLEPLQGTPLVEHTVSAVLSSPRVDEAIVLVAPGPAGEPVSARFADAARWPRVRCLAEGGPERQDTVRNGLQALVESPPDFVLVHDGARPMLPRQTLEAVLDALAEHRAVIPVLPLVDTIRRVTACQEEVVARESLLRCQTPQGFAWEVLLRAHTQARRVGFVGTDDAQLVENLDEPVCQIRGARRNLKVTSPEDFELAAWLLAHPDWGC